MNELKNKIIDIYNIYDYDWMGYKIDNDLTYHHIIKKEDGGLITLDNGVLLTDRAHIYLHKIERIDKEIYIKINKIFKEINDNKLPINNKQKAKIHLLMLIFEIKNADRLIKKKEGFGKVRKKEAINRRINDQRR